MLNPAEYSKGGQNVLVFINYGNYAVFQSIMDHLKNTPETEVSLWQNWLFLTDFNEKSDFWDNITVMYPVLSTA